MAWRLAKDKEKAFQFLGIQSSDGTAGLSCKVCGKLCTTSSLPIVSDGRGNVYHANCAAQAIEQEISELVLFREELRQWEE